MLHHGESNEMVKIIIKSLFLITMFIGSFNTHAKLIENRDYFVLPDDETIYINEQDEIEVLQFISYGCFYCYLLEPEIEKWNQQRPDGVVFKRVSIPLKESWMGYSRIFYALEMISPQALEQMTPLIFISIHEQQLNLDELLDLVVENGINREALLQYYLSQEVSLRVKQSFILAQQYSLRFVPSIYVNNHYRLILNTDHQYQDVGDKLNQLIEIVKSERGI